MPSYAAYLQHDGADVSHTLSDGLWSAGNGDSPLRRVRQHVSCHLNLSACGLDFARHHEKQRLLSAEKSPVEKQLQLPPNYSPKTHSDEQRAAAYASIFEVCVHQFHSVKKGIFSRHNLYTHNQWHFHDQQARKTHFLTRLIKSLLVLLESESTRAPKKIFVSLYRFVEKSF